MRAILLVGLLAIVPLSALAPLAQASGGWCTNEINDDGSCHGILCVWPSPTFDGACVPLSSTEKVCTQGHDACQGLDLVCVYGKFTECVMGCACLIAGGDASVSVGSLGQIPEGPRCSACNIVTVCAVEHCDPSTQTCIRYDGLMPACYVFNCACIPAADPAVVRGAASTADALLP